MKQTRKLNERGMVSIFVTMIMMLIISLIVLGFAQVARRNQRESLDRQLSTQAFYAAESGVNKAISYLKNNPGYQTDTLTNPDCKTFMTSAGLPGTLGGSASYTCLMVDPKPPVLDTAPLDENTSTVWHIQNDNPFSQLEFTWKQNGQSPFSGATNACSNTGFPAYAAWKCSFGIVRVDLVNVTSGTKAATLDNANNNLTLYLMPDKTTAGQTTAAVAATPQAAQVVHAKCTATCDVKLNLPASRQGSEYYARLTMLYQKADDVKLHAQVISNGVSGAANFLNGQAIIDSTGTAQDENRRVQVVVPLVRSSAELPVYGLSSTKAICKQLTVGTNIPSSDGCH